MKVKASKRPSKTFLPQMRIAGNDPSAAAVMAQAAQRADLPVLLPDIIQQTDFDYAQIDNVLAVDGGGKEDASAPPLDGLGYAGLSPLQRRHYLLWLQAPVVPAPEAFQRLCVANLEVRLLESPECAQAACALLLELDQAAAWEEQEQLRRALLLALWVTRDGEQLAEWIASGRTPSPLLGIALGMQAMLGVGLTAAQALTLAGAWRLSPPLAPIEVVALRLLSLHEKSQPEPLALALAQLPEEARRARPWRCTHRDLRIAVPQPDLRAVFTPFLGELTSGASQVDSAREPEKPLASSETEKDEQELTANSGWNLIVEFQESTSSLSAIALQRARRMPGYSAIMDEHRRIIHRVRYRRSEMRSFWYLWEVIQSWTHTHVFVNGAELEKWKVAPYSPYLR